MPEGAHVIKDGLFEAPEIFHIIRESSGADNREMYQVFNMGTRMEIYTNEQFAQDIIGLSEEFGIDAKVIGRVEKSDASMLTLKIGNESLAYRF